MSFKKILGLFKTFVAKLHTLYQHLKLVTVIGHRLIGRLIKNLMIVPTFCIFVAEILSFKKKKYLIVHLYSQN